MKRIYIYNLVLSLCGVLFFSSCNDEEFPGGNNTDLGDEIEVTFQYELSGMSVPETRTTIISEENMNKITKIDLLVYSIDEDGDEAYAYHRGIIQGSHIHNGSSGSFRVRLARSKEGEKYSIDILANIGNSTLLPILDEIPIGTKREKVRAQLTTTGLSFNSSSTLYMWAGIPPMVIDSYTDFSPLTFIRSLARLDIGLNMDQSDVPHPPANFTLTYAGFIYHMPRVYLIPDRDNIQNNKVVAHSIPSSVSYSLSTSTISRTIADNCYIAGLFMSESRGDYVSMDTRYFSIIIGGNYTAPDGTTSMNYYRIAPRDPDNPEKRLDILRNHKYRINILKVEGPGYSTAGLAATGTEASVMYELTVQEEGDINHVVYNKEAYLGVSTTLMECAPAAGTYDLKVRTSVTGGWRVTRTNENGSTPSWITVSPANGAVNTTGTVGLTLQANNTGAPRSAILTFTAGELSLKVRVLQNGGWYIYSDYPGTLMRGDGDAYNVSVHGTVPSNLQVRAYGPLRDLPLSYETLTYAGGIVGAGTPQTQTLEIVGNAWLPIAIRDVMFQYSTDNGTTWVTFEEGRQGKGHFKSRESGRIVALYDYENSEGYSLFTWAEAMGIDLTWNTGQSVYYYTTVTLPNGLDNIPPFGIVPQNNRNALFYQPTENSGCADYYEKGYEDEYPKGQWRLPSVTEMVEMNEYRDYIGDLAINGAKYWSSTNQRSATSTPGSYSIYLFPSGTEFWTQELNPQMLRVRCVFGDPDINVLKEKYSDWYYNPSTELPSEGQE